MYGTIHKTRMRPGVHKYDPEVCQSFSMDKEKLLNDIARTGNESVVVEVDLTRPLYCQPLEGSICGREFFFGSVDRVINTKLTHDFRDRFASLPDTRNLVQLSGFKKMASESFWFFFGQLENGTIVGVNVTNDSVNKLTMSAFYLQKDSVFVKTVDVGEVPTLTVNDFINFAKFQLEVLITHVTKKESINVSEKNSITRSVVNIGLDYDGTVTSDYYAFVKLVELFRNRGHKVYIVTMRYESECRQDANFMRLTEMADGWCPTGRMAKRKYCEQQGLKIHIWIDDNPIAVEKDAIDIWGTVSPEGSVVIEEHGTKVTNGE